MSFICLHYGFIASFFFIFTEDVLSLTEKLEMRQVKTKRRCAGCLISTTTTTKSNMLQCCMCIVRNNYHPISSDLHIFQYYTRLRVRQTMSSRNMLSSLNHLACSSLSSQSLSRLSRNLGLRRFRLGSLGLDAVSFGAYRNSDLDAFNRIRPFSWRRRISFLLT